MGAVICTRTATPNRRAHEKQQAVGEFHDIGRTRPGLDQLLATVHDGQASAVVVADFDRLSRSCRTFTQIVKALNEAGCPYVVEQRRVNLPATPELGVMIAEYEAERSEEDFTL